MKYGLIGCGRISPNHIASAIKNDLEIVSICDVNESNMDSLVKQFNLKGLKKYTNYIQMLEKENLDLVAICTESGSHGEIALVCLDYNCHLIIEKPIALSLDEADEIIKKASQKNLKVSACHQNRFNKSIQKIREALEKGRFGKLFHGAAHIRWNRNEEYYKQASWRGTWEQDGGALMNQCIHNIDLLRWMMGDEIVEVVGMTDNLAHNYIETEDLGLALIRFKNGSYGLVEGTNNVYPNNLEETLYIFGEKGTVKAGGKSVNLIEEWNFLDRLDSSTEIKQTYKEDPPNIYGFGHNPLYADVIDAITYDREPYVSAKDGRNALELVLGIYKAAKEKKNVTFPLNSVKTKDFGEI